MPKSNSAHTEEGRYDTDKSPGGRGNAATAQPGKHAAPIPKAHGDGSKPGQGTKEGRAGADGLGHDERGEYGRGERDFETPERYVRTATKT